MESPAQRPYLDQAPTSMKRRYAIIFNEGSGYFLVDSWKRGVNASTMLVRSWATGQICVRRLSDLLEGSVTEWPVPPEVLNQVDHYHIPQLLGWRTYPDPRPDKYGQYLNYATIWQLCNGAQLHEIGERQIELNTRVPEAVLWNFFKSGLESILVYSSHGIAHGDLHQGNILLDWPGDSPMPEFYFIDFGGSHRYPRMEDYAFQLPWTGVLDYINVRNGRLTEEEYSQLLGWYDMVFSDMRKLMRHIHMLIAKTYTERHLCTMGRVADRERYFFNALARRGEGVEGYSGQLIKALAAWSNIMHKFRAEPAECYRFLHMLLTEVKNLAGPYCHNFLTSGTRALQSTAWMRSPMLPNKIQTYKDPQPLFDLRPPRYDLASMTDPETYADGAYAEADDNHPHANLRILLPMTEEVKLRQGQYQVVEILFDEVTGVWQPLKVVDSMDDVQRPLSPDSATPTFFNPFIPTDATDPIFSSTGFDNTDPSYPTRSATGDEDSTLRPLSAHWFMACSDSVPTHTGLQSSPQVQPLPDSVWLLDVSTADAWTPPAPDDDEEDEPLQPHHLEMLRSLNRGDVQPDVLPR